MNCEHVAFVGGGRITRICLATWERAGRLPERLAVIEPDAVAAELLTRLYPQVHLCQDSTALPPEVSVVFLAVHPPQVLPAAESLASHVTAETLIVSLAPKITLAQLAAKLPATTRVARCLPNAAAMIGQGFNPLSSGDHWDQPAHARLRQLLQHLGECPEVPENDLEAYAILTAMGPTYFWFQWQQLRELAAELGLAEAQATRGITAMLQGAIALQFDAGLSYDAVVDLIPVRPLREDEEALRKVLKDRLSATYQKIKPS